MERIYKDFDIKIEEGFEIIEILKALRNFSHARLSIIIIEEIKKTQAGDPEINILAKMNEGDIDEAGQIISQGIAGAKLHEE